MLDEQTLRFVNVVLKVLKHEPLSTGDFRIWLEFLKIPPQIEQVNVDQVQQLLAEARSTFKQYATPQQ